MTRLEELTQERKEVAIQIKLLQKKRTRLRNAIAQTVYRNKNN